MRWDDIYISGTGRFLPKQVATSELLGVDGYDRNALKLADYVSYTESFALTAPEMAARAARIALDASGHRADDIAALVYAQFDETDHVAPACHVQRILAAPQALAFELGAASAGGVTGLVVAANLLHADTSARAALVTAAGRHLPPRWNSRQVLGLVLGDGAVATVLSRGSGLARLVASAHSAMPDLETLCTVRTDDTTVGAQRLPIVRIGLGPFLDDMRATVGRVVDDVLQTAEVTMAEVTRVAVTGVGLTQLSAIVLEPLGITAAQTTWPFLREVGHVGACDPLLGVDHLLRDGHLRHGDTVLVLGIGLGFRHTCVLMEIVGDPTANQLVLSGHAEEAL